MTQVLMEYLMSLKFHKTFLVLNSNEKATDKMDNFHPKSLAYKIKT